MSMPRALASQESSVRLPSFAVTPHPAFQTCPNEPWSFGGRVLALITRAMRAREALRPYLHTELAKATQTGRPLNRPLFFDFADDPASAAVGYDQFMCGDEIMVAPVLHADAVDRKVWFPPGPKCWASYWNRSNTYAAGAAAVVPASLDDLAPAFVRCK